MTEYNRDLMNGESSYCHGCKKYVPKTSIVFFNILHQYCLDCTLEQKERELEQLVNEIDGLKQKKEQSL